MIQQLSPDKIKEGQILLFDKPYGLTSFQLVNKIRWLLCRKYNWKKLKVGHAGTLDPLATGLMIICTGKATKQIPELMGLDKEYMAEFKLGETTPSYDKETKVDSIYPTDHITKELVEETLHLFKGEIEQVPPAFSAKQVNGVRAYDYARKGIDIKLKPSLVVIHKFELIQFKMPFISFLINCSKGTYIRSLARDLGKNLNSGSYLTALKRTKIGEYQLIHSLSVEKFEKNLNET